MKRLNSFLLLFCISITFLKCASNEAIEKVNENTFEVLTYSAELSETITLDISEIVLGKSKEYKYWTKNYQNPQNQIQGRIHPHTNRTLIPQYSYPIHPKDRSHQLIITTAMKEQS